MSRPRTLACRPSDPARRLLLAGLGGSALLATAGLRASYTLTDWSGRTPPLALDDLQGRPWSLGQHKGKLVLLNFWATWCEPCRAEMPSLQALATRLGISRLVVAGINYQDPVSRIERFLQQTPLDFPILLDKDGQAAKTWTRRIFPTTVLVGPDGRARASLVGEFDWTSPQADALISKWLPR